MPVYVSSQQPHLVVGHELLEDGLGLDQLAGHHGKIAVVVIIVQPAPARRAPDLLPEVLALRLDI